MSQPGLSWVTAGSTSTLKYQVSKHQGWWCCDQQNVNGSVQCRLPTPGEGSPLGHVGGGDRAEGARTRALYHSCLTSVLFPDFQTPGLPSICPAGLDHSRQIVPSQAQAKYPSPGFSELQPPRLGWEASCQGKYQAPASRRLPALTRVPHALNSPEWLQKGKGLENAGVGWGEAQHFP